MIHEYDEILDFQCCIHHFHQVEKEDPKAIHELKLHLSSFQEVQHKHHYQHHQNHHQNHRCSNHHYKKIDKKIDLFDDLHQIFEVHQYQQSVEALNEVFQFES